MSIRRGNKKYEPTKLYRSFHVAGFQFYDGMEVILDLKPGMELDLVPEFDNPYDSQAVALYYGDAKLGFVPRHQNGTLAQMMFFGQGDVFVARVQQVNLLSDLPEQLLVGIYVKDAR